MHLLNIDYIEFYLVYVFAVLLTATLQKHLNKFNAVDPELADKFVQSLHGDDFISRTEI